MNEWQNAYNTWSQGGTGVMAGGYPVTSGSGTFPRYNGSASGPSTVQPPTPGSNPDGDGEGSTGDIVYNPKPWSNKPYGSDSEQTTFDFGARLSKFFDDLKQTPIFSLPSSLLADIPGEGTSVITFEAGRFGRHSFDFASLGSVLVTMRVLTLCTFGALGIKIITRKG
jgi:hypothetical protein